VTSSTPDPAEASGAGKLLHRSFVVQALVIVAVALVLFLPGLGSTGLSMSEGHRVVPGWEMLERGDWRVPHMFGRVYLRKPPGMPWAIAASSMVFGKTELAARLVSVVATALAGVCACWFARRWYGARWGLCAGLALVLMPVFWSPARSAEIESLHNFFVLGASLAMLDLALGTGSRARVAVLGGIALGGALLTKGPAGLPVVGAAVVAAFAATGGAARTLVRITPSVLIASVMVAPVFLAMRDAAELPGAVTQGVDEFLWSARKIPEILALPVLGLLAALPASLALLFPWGPDARTEPAGTEDAAALRVARVVSITFIGTVLAYAAIGVSNPRYVMPALGLAALAAPYVCRGGSFTPKRTAIARVMVVGSPRVLAALLVLAGVISARSADRARAQESGAAAGATLVRSVRGDDVEVWADHAIEARPEVLLEIQRLAAAEGRRVQGVWAPISPKNLPPSGSYLLIREDDQSDERERLAHEGVLGKFRKVGGADFYKFSFGLYLRGS
jgi:4-amino-4-deoxy-L-arabinose transferase-like glycosyltransferase